MGMNEAEIAAVCRDLQSLVGAPLSEVRQPARDRLVLTLGGTHLLLVPRGPLARIHPIERRPRNPKKPFSFQGACRAHLTGRLDRIEKVDGDRIVEIVFGEVRLHLRLTGRGGGLWMCRREEVLAARHTTPKRLKEELAPDLAAPCQKVFAAEESGPGGAR